MKAIWCDDERKELYAQLFRDIELPFAPSIGLEVTLEGWSSGKAERVIWDHEDERFFVEVTDEIPFSRSGYDYSAEWLLQKALDLGWEGGRVP